jgi:hypothetical protein
LLTRTVSTITTASTLTYKDIRLGLRQFGRVKRDSLTRQKSFTGLPPWRVWCLKWCEKSETMRNSHSHQKSKHTHTLSLSLSHTHTHTHTHSHSHTHTHTHTHTHIHTYTHTDAHTHTCTNESTHTHTHTLSLSISNYLSQFF